MSRRVLGACIEVHRHCGPGLLESAYEQCLAHELILRGLRFQRQVRLRLEYKDLVLEDAYQADFIIEDALLVELKAVEALAPIHLAQTLTYLHLTNLDVGLVVNFNSAYLRDGVRRLRRRPRANGHVAALARVPWPEHL